MSLSLNKPKLDNLASDIWKSAERLRGKFKAYEYQGVILPIIVIRRLECVLLAWREAAQLKAAGEIVGIELLDHIIFNKTGYFSFLEAGRL
jgi:type I restriction-modification system DNA methylase subunit